MQWNDINNVQITIYEMGEKNVYPLTLRYCSNKLFCGKKEVEFSVEKDTIFWRQENIKGSMSFINDSRLLRGTLIDERGTHFIKASIDTKISMKFVGEEEKSFDLVLGSRREGDDIIDFVAIREPDKEIDLGYGAVYEQEDEGEFHTHIRGSILPITDGYIGFGFFDVFFDDSYTKVNGHAWKKEEGYRETPPVYSITGSYDEIYKTLSKEGKQSLKDGKTVFSDMEKTELLKYNQTLCVEELFSLPMPVIEDINANYPQALYDLMRYSISEEQLKYIGNPGRPSYSEAERAEVDALLKDKEVKRFLTEDYYYAYLSQMLASNPEMKYASYITNIKNYDKKLGGFYNKSLKTSMNADKGYQKISETIYPQMYFKNSPLIKSYLGEKKAWAVKVHDYSLYHEKTYEMLDDFSHNNQSRVQNTVQILNYFDNTKTVKMENQMQFSYMDAEASDYYISYGTDIYYNLYNRMLVLEAYQFQFDACVLEADERKLFYKEATRRMLENIRNKENLTEEERQFKEAIEESISKKEFSTWEEVYAWMSVFLCELEALVAGSEEYTFKALKELLDSNRKVAAWTKGCAMAVCQLLMLINQIMNFTDWKSLSTATKTQTLLSFTYTLVDATTSIVGLCIESGSAQVEAMSSSGSEIVAATQNTVRPTQVAGSAEITQVTSESSRFIDRLKASASKMSTLSKISGSILTALAFAVSVCDIINDEETYGTGSAVYWLDITTSVVNGVAFLATAGFSLFGGALMGLTAFAALLPGIGFVATLIGILLAFVTFLVKRYAKTLEEKYIENHCVPFVEGLELPEDEDNIIDLVYDSSRNLYYYNY